MPPYTIRTPTNDDHGRSRLRHLKATGSISIHKFAVLAKCLVDLIDLVQNCRTQHSRDMLSSVTFVRLELGELAKSETVGRGKMPVRWVNGRRCWSALAQMENREEAVGVCWGRGCGRGYHRRAPCGVTGAVDVYVQHGSPTRMWSQDDGRGVITHVAGVLLDDTARHTLLLLGGMVFLPVEKLSQPSHTRARENAEDLTLVIVKLRRGFATESKQLIPQECLNSGEREVGKFRAVLEKDMNALRSC